MAEQESEYNLKPALPNKLLNSDDTVTDIAGNPVTTAVEVYKHKQAIPNKFLNPDGSYSTLGEILSEMIDTDLFIIVEELPETGEENKIYLLAVEDKLIEYIWVNNAWDPVGMIEFDINNYYTKDEVTGLISAALTDAKGYADGVAASAQSAAVTAANNYTDTQIQQKITQVLNESY